MFGLSSVLDVWQTDGLLTMIESTSNIKAGYAYIDVCLFER